MNKVAKETIIQGVTTVVVEALGDKSTLPHFNTTLPLENLPQYERLMVILKGRREDEAYPQDNVIEVQNELISDRATGLLYRAALDLLWKLSRIREGAASDFDSIQELAKILSLDSVDLDDLQPEYLDFSTTTGFDTLKIYQSLAYSIFEMS